MDLPSGRGPSSNAKTSRTLRGVHTVRVEEGICSGRAKRRKPIHQESCVFKSKARVEDGPRSRNKEVESCSVLVWDSCWWSRRQFLLTLGGLDAVDCEATCKVSSGFEAWCIVCIIQRHYLSSKRSVTHSASCLCGIVQLALVTFFPSVSLRNCTACACDTFPSVSFESYSFCM